MAKVIYGHTLEELAMVQDDYCWNFLVEDFINGAIAPQDNMVYWLIGDRLYETTINA